MKPRISVISVNYNGFALTAAMIDSLRRHVTTPLEIVVVDNGSQRDEATELQERYPEIIAIRSPENLGFAGGNNLGIRAASGDRLLLLNNDTEVGDDTLHYLAETLDADPSVGAVCPKIRFWAPPQAIQFAGYTPLTRITLRNALVGFGQPDDGSRDTPHTTPYAHGAAMMVRREAVEKAGPMRHHGPAKPPAELLPHAQPPAVRPPQPPRDGTAALDTLPTGRGPSQKRRRGPAVRTPGPCSGRPARRPGFSAP